MPEVVGDLAQQAELAEVFRNQPAHRKPVQRGTASKQHDQQQGEQERRQGIANDDQAAAPGIERRAVAHRLADPQRNRHQVGDQRGPEAERQGHRHLLQDQVGNLGAAKEAGTEVQPGILAEHQPQAFRRGLVEAVLALDVFQQLGVQAAAGARAGVQGFGAGPGRTAANALQARNRLLDRAARRGLDDDEIDQQDDQQGRDDQQQAPQDIGNHRWASLACTRALSCAICSLVSATGLTSHQVSMASSLLACTSGIPKRFHHTVDEPGG
ncbi:hypothetical protein D3C81_1335790 [compost metagenome]